MKLIMITLQPSLTFKLFRSLLDCEKYELRYKLRQFDEEIDKHKYVIRKETIKSVVNVYSKYLQTHFYVRMILHLKI